MKYTKLAILGIFFSMLYVSTAQGQTNLTNLEETNPCEDEFMPPLTLQDLSPEERKEAIMNWLRTGDCEYDGITLKGKVEFVTAFPDIKIEYVDAFPDIRVQFVDAFPDDCGEWQKVTSFPDFKVQVVDAFPDVKVQIVDSFPGVR